MSFGSQSIRSEPMPGAGTSPTVPSVRPIGPFLGSAGAASNRHSRNGEGRFKATMGFEVISDHSVNAREANRSSRGKRAGKFDRNSSCAVSYLIAEAAHSGNVVTQELPIVLGCSIAARFQLVERTVNCCAKAVSARFESEGFPNG